LFIWIEIETPLCSYLHTFTFIEFFTNVTSLIFRQCCDRITSSIRVDFLQ